MNYYRINTHVDTEQDKDGLYSFINPPPVSGFIECLGAINNSKWQEIGIAKVVSKKVTLESGVYALCIEDNLTSLNHIAYIGSAENILYRLYSHAILKFLYSNIQSRYTPRIFIYITEKFRKEEVLFINKFKPFLNSKTYPSSIRCLNNGNWKKMRKKFKV